MYLLNFKCISSTPDAVPVHILEKTTGT